MTGASISQNCLITFRAAALKQHNLLRANHGVPALTEAAVLDTYAENWAQTIAQANSASHSMGIYGENLAYEWSSQPPNTNDCSSKINDEAIDLFSIPGYGQVLALL